MNSDQKQKLNDKMMATQLKAQVTILRKMYQEKKLELSQQKLKTQEIHPPIIETDIDDEDLSDTEEDQDSQKSEYMENLSPITIKE